MLKSNAKMPLFRNPFSNLHISGLKWSFAKIQSRRSSVWHWLAIGKGSRSIVPQGAELWPFQDSNCLRNFTNIWFKHLFLKAWSRIFKKSKNLEPSEGSALAIEQGPRTVAPLEGKLQLDRVGNHLSSISMA